MKFAFKTLPSEKGTPIHEVWLNGKLLTQVTDVCFVCQAGHAPKVRLEFVPTEIDVDADVVAISDPPKVIGEAMIARSHVNANANGDVWANYNAGRPSNAVFPASQSDEAMYPPDTLDTATSSRGARQSWGRGISSNVLPLPGADYQVILPGKPFTVMGTPKIEPNAYIELQEKCLGEVPMGAKSLNVSGMSVIDSLVPIPKLSGKWNFIHVMPPLFQAAPTTPHTRDELVDAITVCTRHLMGKEPAELFTTKAQRIRLAEVLFSSRDCDDMRSEDNQNTLQGKTPSSAYHAFVQGPVGTLLGVPLRDAAFFAVCGKLFSGDRVWVTTVDNLDALKVYIEHDLKGLLRVGAS